MRNNTLSGVHKTLAAGCFAIVAGMSAVSCFAELSLSTDTWAGRKAHLAVVNPPVQADDGYRISLCGEWDFAAFRHALESRDLQYELEKDFWGRDGVWKNVRKIQVPGCWEAQGVGKEDFTYRYNSTRSKSLRLRHAHLGNGFYRRKFTVPESWKGRRIWLKVGQLRNWGWIWVDGKAVAHVAEAYRALKWEITDLVSPGKTSTIVVQTDNSYTYRNSQTMSFGRWGGITRDIELEATPSAFIDDAWVRGDFDAKTAKVHVSLAGETGGFVLAAEIEGRRMQISAKKGECVLTVPLTAFRPWSPEAPNLYTAKVELVKAGKTVSTRFERFGVRKLEVRGKEFYLNGRPFFFRGFGDDSVYPITGNSPASREYHRANFRIAKAAGFNAVRLHTHYELPEYFDAADELGILVQPELSYNCDESSVEMFSFDPVGDAAAAWQGYRRHPSFAIYSGGNEGTLGPYGGKALFDWVHSHDPDRLVIEQDGGTYFRGHRTDTSDYASGPMSMWERGSFNRRAFICHEYGNIAVKGDARMEGDYTGVWMPRMTRKMRLDNLAPAGLDEEWGNRLQDAQHDLQRFWIRRSIEAARKDPFCDGYSFWTIVDCTHQQDDANAVNAQGVFDPFWRAKPCGTIPEELAIVNSPVAILLDTENRERQYKEDDDPLLCCGSLRRLVIDETNRVYCAGEKIPAEFILAHYGAQTINSGELDWKLSASGKELAAGIVKIGDQESGPARRVAKFAIEIPSVDSPVKAVLSVDVRSQAEEKIHASNHWNFYIFPKARKSEIPPSVAVVKHGSPEAEQARKAGKNLLLLGKCGKTMDIFLGWWAIDWRPENWTQNGVAIKPHELWKSLPREKFLTPLFFGIIGEAEVLPVAGFSCDDFIMVGEGNVDFKLYLAAKTRADGGREVFVSGLDVFSENPAAKALLSDIVGWLAK